MSIATRSGDDGSTSLLYGRRLSKTDPQVEAYGTVDELNSALGLARATALDPWVKEQIFLTQKDLVVLMGTLAVAEEDRRRYEESSHPQMQPAMLQRLDEAVARIESQNVSFSGWATPGDSLHSAALDVARTVCRRAERRILAALPSTPPENHKKIVMPFLNRLSDLLWLMARLAETAKNSGD